MPVLFAEGFEYLCRKYGHDPRKALQATDEDEDFVDFTPSAEHQMLEHELDVLRFERTGVTPDGHRLR